MVRYAKYVWGMAPWPPLTTLMYRFDHNSPANGARVLFKPFTLRKILWSRLKKWEILGFTIFGRQHNWSRSRVFNDIIRAWEKSSRDNFFVFFQKTRQKSASLEPLIGPSISGLIN